MEKQDKFNEMSRRDFLKATAASAAALGLAGVFVPRRAQAYEPGQTIHPHISPLRVVGIHDPEMTTDQRLRVGWSDQEAVVNAEAVASNMDRVACALAEEKQAAAAWRKIFLKPAGKAWSDAVVAIKTNHIAQQHTRSPVMAKLCHALTDVLGVTPSNVHIYDACNGASLEKDTPFKGLPEGVRIENQWGGSSTPTPVPAPWSGGTAKCLGPLARGEVDILINVALCKAHGAGFGNFTLTVKNHLGTFETGPAHQAGALDYLLAINKSRAVLGETDAKGNVAFPRQQLCIVDCLWASKGGPGGNPDVQPNRLFMGVFGPVVDYQLATRFRRDTMGWPINERATERFLTEFGFSPKDLPAQIADAAQYA